MLVRVALLNVVPDQFLLVKFNLVTFHPHTEERKKDNAVRWQQSCQNKHQLLSDSGLWSFSVNKQHISNRH